MADIDISAEGVDLAVKAIQMRTSRISVDRHIENTLRALLAECERLRGEVAEGQVLRDDLARSYANAQQQKYAAQLQLSQLQAASEAREAALIEAKADQLWRICVDDGFPWADGGVQDQLTEMGLLYRKDMDDEASGPECATCCGECGTCYRAVEHVRETIPCALNPSAVVKP